MEDAAVMDRRRATQRRINVGPFERLASTTVGGILVARAIRKRSLGGFAEALVGANLIYRGVTGYCGMYSRLGVNTAIVNKAGSQIDPDSPEVRRAVTVGRSPEELYEFWSNPANLARIMDHFAEVTPRDGALHWRVRGPLKQVFEWDSRPVEEEAGRKLSWQTLPGGTLANHGDVTFRPGPNGTGTEVTLHLKFEPPLGNVGKSLAKAFRLVPRAVVGQALRRFKSLVETGEIPTLEHNPSARGSSDTVDTGREA